MWGKNLITWNSVYWIKAMEFFLTWITFALQEKLLLFNFSQESFSSFFFIRRYRTFWRAICIFFCWLLNTCLEWLIKFYNRYSKIMWIATSNEFPYYQICYAITFYPTFLSVLLVVVSRTQNALYRFYMLIKSTEKLMTVVLGSKNIASIKKAL